MFHLGKAATLVTAVACLSGCVAIPHRSPPPPTCSSHFDVQGSAEPLGSSATLLTTLNQAAQTDGFETTLGEMTAKAGWTDGWDRVVEHIDRMSDAAMNTLAGTRGICWHIPQDPIPNSASGTYIFFAGQTPVQAVRWAGSEDVLDLDSLGDVASPTTRLRAKPEPDNSVLVAVD